MNPPIIDKTMSEDELKLFNLSVNSSDDELRELLPYTSEVAKRIHVIRNRDNSVTFL